MSPNLSQILQLISIHGVTIDIESKPNNFLAGLSEHTIEALHLSFVNIDNIVHCIKGLQEGKRTGNCTTALIAFNCNLFLLGQAIEQWPQD